MRNVLVSGASSQIGTFLLPLLVQHGYQCRCVSRRQHDDCDGIHWIKADMYADMSHVWGDCGADVWIHLGFLPLAVPHLDAASDAGIKRFIGFSSTSIFTKKETENSTEYQTIQHLIEAEASMQSVCQHYAVGWTLFRPTMIYGCGMDHNITFIQKVIQRFGLFPVAGGGKGLRQPVHVEDLALSCIAALQHKDAENKAYNLSGAEVLSYRIMVERIFSSLNRRSRIISIPVPVYKIMIIVLKRISSRFAFIQTSMVDRMNMDMAFEHDDARRDFDYKPRSFQP